MPFSPDAITQQVQERLKALYTLTREIEEERIRSESSINNLLKAKEKMTPEEKRSSNQVVIYILYLYLLYSITLYILEIETTGQICYSRYRT